MEYLVLFAAALFILYGVHFIPFAQLMGKSELPRLIAYAIGLGVILIIFTFYAIITGHLESLAAIWTISIGAGLGTCAGYLHSREVDRNRVVATAKTRVKELKQENSLLMDMRDEPGERT